MGNVLEAIFGAMYLEQGFRVTKDRALKMFQRHSDMAVLVDARTELDQVPRSPDQPRVW